MQLGSKMQRTGKSKSSRRKGFEKQQPTQTCSTEAKNNKELFFEGRNSCRIWITSPFLLFWTFGRVPTSFILCAVKVPKSHYSAGNSKCAMRVADNWNSNGQEQEIQANVNVIRMAMWIYSYRRNMERNRNIVEYRVDGGCRWKQWPIKWDVVT